MFRELWRRLTRKPEPGEIDMRPTRDRLLTQPADNQYREGRGANEAFHDWIGAGGGPPGGHQ